MKNQEIFEFSEFRLDSRTRTLKRQGEAVALTRRAFDLLLYLVQNPGRIVPRDELVKNVWPDTSVDDNSLAQSISALRRALEEKPGDNNYLVTVPGRGYQFVAEVKNRDREVAVLAPAGGAIPGTPSGLILERETIRASITRVEPDLLGLPAAKRPWMAVGAVLALAIAAAAAAYVYFHRGRKLSEKETVVLGDFDNNTGDAVFDGTLRRGLAVELEQSPNLNLLSDQRIGQTLALMTKPKDARLTPETAHEVCQRTASAAVLNGTIAQIGERYLLTLQAMNCANGETLASSEAEASDKNHVLDALGKVGKDMRGQLGESLATVQKYDVDLRQATTPSLEALKAVSLGHKFLYRGDPTQAPAYFQRAIELDPNFAMAYLYLGISYYTTGQPGRAMGAYAKAFSLREHASSPEKLSIDSAYYWHVTGEIDKAIEAMQEVVVIYQHNSAYLPLTILYSKIGQYDKAADAARKLIASDPDRNFGFANLAAAEIALQDFSGARQVIQQAQARGIDGVYVHAELYTLDFLQSDSAGMEEQARWYASQPRFAGIGLENEANTEAYAGHVKQARGLNKQALEYALGGGNKDVAGSDRANWAMVEAGFGNNAEARQSAEEALKLAGEDNGAAVQAALALAMTGDTAKAESVMQELNKSYPLDTQVQLLGLPMIRAQLDLEKHDPVAALNALRPGLPIELADVPFSSSTSCLYPAYIRGEAYLAQGDGAAAASEFQKIIDHSGIVENCWTGALAHLGIARGNALAAKNAQARATSAYKDFLTIWKNADPDIPIYQQAKAEYAKLQ